MICLRLEAQISVSPRLGPILACVEILQTFVRSAEVRINDESYHTPIRVTDTIECLTSKTKGYNKLFFYSFGFPSAAILTFGNLVISHALYTFGYAGHRFTKIFEKSLLTESRQTD